MIIVFGFTSCILTVYKQLRHSPDVSWVVKTFYQPSIYLYLFLHMPSIYKLSFLLGNTFSTFGQSLQALFLYFSPLCLMKDFFLQCFFLYSFLFFRSRSHSRRVYHHLRVSLLDLSIFPHLQALLSIHPLSLLDPWVSCLLFAILHSPHCSIIKVLMGYCNL